MSETSVVTLLPGPAARVLGLPVPVRNERVALRMGATLAQGNGRSATPDVLVPAGMLIEPALFPIPELASPTWLDAGHGAAVLAGPAGTLTQYAADLARAANLPRQPIAPNAVLDASTPSARRRSAWTILKRTEKATDGWVSRNCSRPISRVVSYAMLVLRFKANHASLFTLLVGLAAAYMATHPGYLPLIGSGILFHLASVIDGVDGEMARSTLTESEFGALLDTLVDQVTYIAFFLGVMIGWFREGAGMSALASVVVVAVALVLSLMRGGRFVSRYAPNASFVFIDRAVRRAAHDSGRAALRVAAALFSVMRRDAFAAIFFLVALVGQRVLVPALIAPFILVANFTLSRYRTELAAAAIALEAGG